MIEIEREKKKKEKAAKQNSFHNVERRYFCKEFSTFKKSYIFTA